MNLTLTNKTAIITGGTKGIGLGIAEKMAAENMRIAVTGRHQDEIDALQASLQKLGAADALGFKVDVRDVEGMNNTVCLFLLFSSFDTKPKKFPEISYVTTTGETFTNNDFKEKNTIVVLFHLGCPPAMSVLQDIEKANLDENKDVQIIGIVANTPQQIRDFNSTTDNSWSALREQFSLQPVQIPLIGECDANNVRKDEDGDVVIGKQCTKLGKKLKTRYSPTLVYVNRQGQILKIMREYPGIESLTETSSIFPK